MAKAGDGAARSDHRRLMATISLRVSDAEKHRFTEAAMRNGFPSLAAWVLDRMRRGQGPGQEIGPRAGRVLCGRLGALGARLSALAMAPGSSIPDQLRQDLAELAGAVLALQHEIGKGVRDAGEGDPEPRS